MAEKPILEVLAHSVKALETKNAEKDQEIEGQTLSEYALKNSQILLQTLIDTVEGQVFVKDSSGKYLFVNNAFGKDFDIDPKTVIGKDDFFVFSPEIAAALQKNDQRIMAGKTAETIEESGVLKGRHLTISTSPATRKPPCQKSRRISPVIFLIWKVPTGFYLERTR